MGAYYHEGPKSDAERWQETITEWFVWTNKEGDCTRSLTCLEVTQNTILSTVNKYHCTLVYTVHYILLHCKWSITSHFSCTCSTCFVRIGLRIRTFTSSFPPTDLRPSISCNKRNPLQQHWSECSEWAMGWTTKELGFDSWHEQEISLFSSASRLALGPSRLFPGKKVVTVWSWPLTPPTAEGKNEWSQASIPAHAFNTTMPSILTLYNATIS